MPMHLRVYDPSSSSCSSIETHDGSHTDTLHGQDVLVLDLKSIIKRQRDIMVA